MISPLLVHLGVGGEGVGALRRVGRLQLERVLPAPGARGAAVDAEAVEAGDAEGARGAGLLVEVERGVLEDAVAPGPAGRRRGATHALVLLAQVARAVGALDHAGRLLLEFQGCLEPRVGLGKLKQ